MYQIVEVVKWKVQVLFPMNLQAFNQCAFLLIWTKNLNTLVHTNVNGCDNF